MDPSEKHFPSPESLARKILIKGKKLPTLNPKLHRRLKRSLDITLSADVSDEVSDDSPVEEEEGIQFEKKESESDDEMSETEEKIDSMTRRHSDTENKSHLEVSKLETNRQIDVNLKLFEGQPHQSLGIAFSSPAGCETKETSASNKV